MHEVSFAHCRFIAALAGVAHPSPPPQSSVSLNLSVKAEVLLQQPASRRPLISRICAEKSKASDPLAARLRWLFASFSMAAGDDCIIGSHRHTVIWNKTPRRNERRDDGAADGWPVERLRMPRATGSKPVAASACYCSGDAANAAEGRFLYTFNAYFSRSFCDLAL
jgi:hypothetical protein